MPPNGRRHLGRDARHGAQRVANNGTTWTKKKTVDDGQRERRGGGRFSCLCMQCIDIGARALPKHSFSFFLLPWRGGHHARRIRRPVRRSQLLYTPRNFHGPWEKPAARKKNHASGKMTSEGLRTWFCGAKPKPWSRRCYMQVSTAGNRNGPGTYTSTVHFTFIAHKRTRIHRNGRLCQPEPHTLFPRKRCGIALVGAVTRYPIVTDRPTHGQGWTPSPSLCFPQSDRRRLRVSSRITGFV